MSLSNTVRGHALDVIQAMIADNVISAQDLMRFTVKEVDTTSPEYIRFEMENWYRTLGIESITGSEFNLKLPYFTREEIKEAYESDEIILCVPKGISRRELGQLFNLSSWAIEDELIGKTTEIEDFWFKTKKTLVPDYLDKEGREVQRTFQKEGMLGMSLERYMVFIARMRYLHGSVPDTKHKTWLTHGKYEGKGMLIAGFDSNMNFSVNAWMPNFHTPIVGGRYVFIPDHI